VLGHWWLNPRAISLQPECLKPLGTLGPGTVGS
jgi:hypothetical protein